MLKEDELVELYEKARKVCLSWGYFDESEDFASWIVIKYMEGKSQHQTLRHSFIDFQRIYRGDKRYAGDSMQLRYRKNISDEKWGKLFIEDDYFKINYLMLLKEPYRTICESYFAKNESMPEIGKRLGYSAVWVYYRLNEAIKIIAESLQKEKVL